MLVDVGNAVFPNPFFPFVGRYGRFENSFVSVDRSHLTSLFFDRHPANQIRNPLFDRQLGILVRVHDPIFVTVDPPLFVNVIGSERANKGKQTEGEGKNQFSHSAFGLRTRTFSEVPMVT